MDVLQKVMFAQSVHRPAKVDVPGYVNFVPALAYLVLTTCALRLNVHACSIDATWSTD